MTRDDIDLLDGDWYAARALRAVGLDAENAPVYHDERNDVWGITLYDDVLMIEKDARTFSSKRAPRPHGDPLPMMISMDNPEHQQRRSLVYRGFTPKRVAGPHAAHPSSCARRSSTRCPRRASATSCGTSPPRSRCS